MSRKLKIVQCEEMKKEKEDAQRGREKRVEKDKIA